MTLTLWERFKLGLKYTISYLCLPLVVILLIPFLFWIMRYRIHNLAKVQQEFEKLTYTSAQQPILICLNHLTRIDSVILACIVPPLRKVFFNYSRVLWHVLDLANLPVFCSILKTIPIVRMGNRKKIRLMQEKVKFLLKRGDLVVIFPEGTRSLNGRVDTKDYQYGVGDILRDLPETRVLCVYLRGNHQIARSNIPPAGSMIDISFEMIHPQTSLEGLRASRELAGQVIAKLDTMEKQYFAEKSLDRK